MRNCTDKDTDQWTGMGNRFFTLNGYHGLVEAHGIIAAITFLGIVPLAIFLMRFYGRNPRLALRMHIWLQILTLLLSTVIIILGFQAVGQNRSLTNPHHGIGVAIYVLVWVQIIGGCMLHRKEKGKRRLYIPLSAMLHHWLGRAIALLGITQVALGLTLYGSPEYLFVLYALWAFFLVVLYFVLQWLAERRRARFGNEGRSSYSDEVVERPDGHGRTGLGKLAAAGAAGAGLAALWRRRSSRRNESPHRVHADGAGTELTGSGSSYYYDDDKMSDRSRHGIGHRLVQFAAVGGAVAAVKKLFDRRRRDQDDESEVGPYRPPLGGNQSVTTDSMSRIEEGRPPPVRPVTPVGGSPGYVRPSHPLAQPPMTPGQAGHRPSASSLSYDSYMSGSPSRRDRRSHTFRDAVAAGGAVFAVRSLFKNRRQKKEEIRAEQLRKERLEQEKVARMNSQHRYTGDGVTPPRRARHGRMGSQTASDLSTDLGPSGMSGAIPAAGGVGVGAAAASALADRNRIRPVGQDPPIVQPGPPTAAGFMPGHEGMPPIPPPHLESSGSELYTTGSGRQRHRHHLRDEAAAGLAGAGLGAAAVDANHRRRHGSRNNNTDSMESPPVSVKINMHNDGRHVTLRRLTEEEAAAQREERRKQRQASAAARRQRRGSSFSGSDSEALAGPSSADRRWRRTEALEAEQAAAAQAPQYHTPQPPVAPPPTVPYPTPPEPGTVQSGTGHSYQMPFPPPPPIPGSASNVGYPAGSGVTSPGTETSGATEYANNRRRRRAERAQARLAREGRTGNTVDFT